MRTHIGLVSFLSSKPQLFDQFNGYSSCCFIYENFGANNEKRLNTTVGSYYISRHLASPAKQKKEQICYTSFSLNKNYLWSAVLLGPEYLRNVKFQQLNLAPISSVL